MHPKSMASYIRGPSMKGSLASSWGTGKEMLTKQSVTWPFKAKPAKPLSLSTHPCFISTRQFLCSYNDPRYPNPSVVIGNNFCDKELKLQSVYMFRIKFWLWHLNF